MSAISLPRPRARRRATRRGWTRIEIAAGIVLALIVLCAVLAPLIQPYDPEAQNLNQILKPPGTPGHLLGTDQLGRDLLSRLLGGALISLGIASAVVAVGVTVGTAVGVLAGLRSGWADTVLMRTMDALLAFPALVLALVIAAGLGPSIRTTIIAVAIVMIPSFARVARSLTRQEVGKEYVLAARANGASWWRIVRVHLLHNISPPIAAQAVLAIAYAIPAEAALSFIGLGVQQPQPSWGNMISDGNEYLADSPWGLVLPALAIVITVGAISVVADGLRRRQEAR